MANIWPEDYVKYKAALPEWVLFFNIAGYDYFPQERVSGQIQDMHAIAGTGLEPVSILSGISASELLELVRHPCAEPYWKLRRTGSCQDLFFLTIYDKLPALIQIVNEQAEQSGYPLRT